MPRARQREIPEPEPVILAAPEPEVTVAVLPEEPRGSLFEDLDDEDVAITVAAPVVSDTILDVIPPLDSDLSPDEKAMFTRLLNIEMPLEVRAKQLGILARKTGQKTAAVGLRAIIEINEITGLRKDRATEAAPMFALPAGSSVSVSITKVVK